MNVKDDDRYVKYLSEKVYSSGDIDSDYELRMFFDELVFRKREDPVEGGLQASMVILSDRFASKVNEGDGTYLHLCEFVNLVKYLKNDHKYFSQKAMKFPMLYYKEFEIVREEGIEIRILDGDDTLMITVLSYNEINDYQKDILKKILFICYSNLDNYQNIEIGISTPNVIVDFTNINKDNFEYIISVVDNKHSRIKR